jgi:hypothetical protein
LKASTRKLRIYHRRRPKSHIRLFSSSNTMFFNHYLTTPTSMLPALFRFLMSICGLHILSVVVCLCASPICWFALRTKLGDKSSFKRSACTMRRASVGKVIMLASCSNKKIDHELHGCRRRIVDTMGKVEKFGRQANVMADNGE